MKELLEYRVEDDPSLVKPRGNFAPHVKRSATRLQKSKASGHLHQIAWHTRDVEKLVYGARIQRTLNEDNPEFKNFDADEWMAAHYNPQEPLAEILDEFIKNVDELCKTLRGLPQEAWSRESRHETMGGELTLQLWVERSLAHIEEHLQTVKKAINK